MSAGSTLSAPHPYRDATFTAEETPTMSRWKRFWLHAWGDHEWVIVTDDTESKPHLHCRDVELGEDGRLYAVEVLDVRAYCYARCCRAVELRWCRKRVRGERVSHEKVYP